MLDTVNPNRMLEPGLSGSRTVRASGDVAVLTVVVTGGMAGRKGATFEPRAMTVMDCVALIGGSPSSVTRNWKVFVVVAGAATVVQVNPPLPGWMAAAGGVSRAGRSTPAWSAWPKSLGCTLSLLKPNARWVLVSPQRSSMSRKAQSIE